MNFELFKEQIYHWAKDRNLISSTYQHQQFVKLIEEAGELASAMIENDRDKIKDAIGDMIVVLVVLSYQLDIDINECLELVFNQIKDRKGLTIEGIFIKEKQNE